MPSSLSQSAPVKVRDLSREFLRSQLDDYFGATAPAELIGANYELWRCAETGLEFCQPAKPGSAAYYEWISQFPSYYPGYRWEYGEVGRLLRAQNHTDTDFKVLDVGCGKGDFLRALDFLPTQKKFALDLNEPAIRACPRAGLQCFLRHGGNSDRVRLSQAR